MKEKNKQVQLTRSYKMARKPQLMALEPRVLFDGAALATALDTQILTQDSGQVVDSSSVDSSLSPEFAAVISATSSASETPIEINNSSIDAIDGLTGNVNPELISIDSQSANLLIDNNGAGLLEFANSNEVSESLTAATLEAQHLIADFMNRSDAREQLFVMFNGGKTSPSVEWNSAFDNLMNSLVQGQTHLRIELRSSSELQGAKGAFSLDGTTGQATIYLNAEWLSGNVNSGIAGADSASISKVLVEEIGHYLDAKLNNGGDTAGDEGELFSRYIIDGDSPLTVSFLSSQDDHAILQIDGQNIDVEMAGFTFVNAYEMLRDINGDGVVQNTEYWAEKEQETHTIIIGNGTYTNGLGQVTVTDGTNNQSFSGNDLSAAATVTIAGQTYYGWISRPVKVGGVVKAFYFWTDSRFTNLALAQADGNQDGDSSLTNNRGFILVVDQSYFTSLAKTSITTTGTGTEAGRTYSTETIKSSSDRVDAALNSLLTSNAAPTAINDTANGVVGASGGAALEEGYNVNTSSVITATVNATGNVLTNDTDSNSDSLNVSNIKSNMTGATTDISGSSGFNVAGKYGALTIYADGSYSYAVDNGNATVNALLSNSLTEAFTYTASDGKGGTSTATLTVQINGSNDAPDAVNDYNSAKEHTTPLSSDTGYDATGNVLPNDTDVDSGDTKSISGVKQIGTADAANIVSTTTASVVRFDAGSGFNKNTVEGNTLYLNVSGTYRAIHGSDNALVYALIGGVTVYSGSVYDVKLSQDVYYYKDASNTKIYLTLAELTGKAVGFKNSTSEIETTSSMKTATLSATTSTGTYTLDLTNYTGSISVGAKVWYDNDSTANINYVDSLLTVKSITYDASGNPIKVTLDGRIPFTDGTKVQFRSSLSTGVQYDGQYGKLVLNADGSYIYTPYTDNPNLNAGDTVVEVFDYTMQDTAGVTSDAKLYITVYGDGTNSPTPATDSASAYESGVGRGSTSPYSLTSDSTSFVGTVATGNVLTNDTLGTVAGTTATVSSYSNEDGTTSASSGSTLTGTYGQLSITSAGVFTYTVTNSNTTVNALAPGQSITETFWYTMTNSAGVTAKEKLVITIQGTNDAPVAVIDNGGTFVEDVTTVKAGNVLGNDTDVDTSDSKSVTKVIAGDTTPTSAVAVSSTSANNGTTVDGTYGRLVIGADGTYTYTLGVTASQISAVQALTTTSHPTETFTYEVTDSYGATSTTTLNFTVDGTSEPPVNQVNGSSFSNSSTLTYTTSVDTAIVFTGAKQLSVSDADGNLSSVTLTVDNGTLSFTGSTGGASLSSASGSTITITGTQSDINAALALLQYTPNTGYTGSDYLTIASKDATNLWDTDSIAINIPTVFTGPTVKESDLSTGSNASGTDETKTTTLTAPTGQSFGSNIQSGSGTYGNWTLNVSTGVFTYTLTSAPSVSGASSTDSVSITTYDDFGNPITNTVLVTINDDAPTANADIDSVTEDLTTTATGNVITGVDLASGNDSNTSDGVADVKGADGSIVTGVQAGTVLTEISGGVGSAIDGVYGRLTLNANGTYSYTLYTSSDTGSAATAGYAALQALNAGDAPTDDFSYTLKDADGDFSNTTLKITVNGSNEVPIFSVNDVSVNEAAGTAVFTVTRTGDSTISASVSYSLSDGTALAGSDYTTQSGTLVFAISETSKTISVAITNDAAFEGSETYTVTLSSPTNGAIIGDGTGLGTILDDGTGSGGANDDRTINVVGGGTFNEASRYATFTVTGQSGYAVNLSLGNTATNTDTDATTTGFTYDYSVDGGSTWTTYTWNGTSGNRPTVPAGGTILVRVAIGTEADTPYEGAETFTLTASYATNSSITDTDADTIIDDGTGRRDENGDGDITDGGAESGPFDDDRTINVVGGGTFNEASRYATFTVTGQSGYAVNLSLGNTATNTDTDATTTGFTYDYSVDGGSTWMTYTWNGTSGNRPTVPAGGTILVRVAIGTEADTPYEGAETFTLTASYATNSSITDTDADTIIDDGTGRRDENGDGDITDGGAESGPFDDDRTINVVGGGTFNEASRYATFTVTGQSGYAVNLSLGNTATNTDTDATTTGFTYDYSVDGGSTWMTYTWNGTSGNRPTVPAGGTILVRVAIGTEADTPYEGAETFTLTASYATNSSITDTDADTIIDDGTGRRDENGDGDITDGGDESGPFNDDRGITVSGIDDVSEGSNSIFTVTLPDGNTRNTEISLALSDGTAGSSDYSGTYSVYYYSGGTKTTLTVTNGAITLPAGITTFYVSVPTTQDTTLEGAENFSLTATITGGKSASDTSTILDDGTGQIYDDRGTNPSGPGNDDRGITVSGIDDVSEGSNSIFTVTLPDGNTRNTEISLALSNGTAGSSDYSATYTVYYYSGGTKTALTVTGGKITLPAGVTTFYVSVPTTQDTTLEGAENFSLTATITGGKSASDTSTILDDGTGQIYDDRGTNPSGPGNDDRGITVSGIDDVSEGSNSIFTVTLPDGNTRNTEISLALSNGTAGSSDYSGTYSVYYYSGGTKTTLTVTNGAITLPAGITTFYVSVPTTQDTTLEGAENFSLTATITGGKSASDTSTILDDGTGQIYDDRGTNPTGPGNDDSQNSTIAVNGLDDVSEGSNSIFTVTLPNGNPQNTEISLSLSNGTAGSSDYSSSYTVYYYSGGTQTALTVTGGKIILPAGVTTFYVSVPTRQDTRLEGAENFSLTAAITGGASASDTSTILDDGTGQIYDDRGTNPSGPGNDDRVRDLPIQPAILKTLLNEVKAVINPVESKAPAPIVTVATTSTVAEPARASGYAGYGKINDEVIQAQRAVDAGLSLPSGREMELRNTVKPPDAGVLPGSELSYKLPTATFTGGKGDLTLLATQKNGQALPSWLKFDPKTGRFTGEVPKDLSKPIEIRVLATDARGTQAEAKLVIKPAKPVTKGISMKGKATFSDQMRNAFRLNS